MKEGLTQQFALVLYLLPTILCICSLEEFSRANVTKMALTMFLTVHETVSIVHKIEQHFAELASLGFIPGRKKPASWLNKKKNTSLCAHFDSEEFIRNYATITAQIFPIKNHFCINKMYRKSAHSKRGRGPVPVLI